MSASIHGDTDESVGARQFLTFDLGAESYGVDILRVQEIRCWSPVTRLPLAQPHVLGVLNLRGSLVPIVDMRMRLGLERAEFTPLTVIVVLSVETAAGVRECGLVVDNVSDVVEIPPAALRPPPHLGGGAAQEFIQSLATLGDRLLILLDCEALVGRGLELGADLRNDAAA
jgi:purine-binding chemotaxis protein CheW